MSSIAKASNRVTNVRWAMVAMLVGFSMVSYVQRMNISVAAEYMIPELGLTLVQMGQIFSAFLLGYSLLQIPMGIIGDRIGAHKLLAAFGLLWGVLTFLSGYLPGRVFGVGMGAFVTLIVTRFVLGVSIAGVYPLSALTVRNWQPIERRASSYSWVVAGVFVGSAITPPIIAWLMVSFGWRETFYVTSTLSIAMGLAWLFYAADSPRKHPRVSPGELALIEGGAVASPSTPSSGAFELASLKALFKHRSLLLLCVSYFLAGYVLYTFVFWFFKYLVDERKFSVLEGGLFGSLPFIAAGILSPLGGQICDRATARLGHRWGRRLPAMVGPLLAATFLVIGARTGNPYLAIAALALSFGFQEFAEGAYWATTMDIGGRLTGSATGILNTANNLGGVVSTALMPVLVAQVGWVRALDSCSLLAFVAALLWLGVKADRPIESHGAAAS